MGFKDVALKDIFRVGLNEPIRSQLPGEKIRWSLEQYIDYALLLSGSSYTVVVAEEERNNPPVSAKPESAHVTPAAPRPAHVTPAAPRPAIVTPAAPRPAIVTMPAAPGPAIVTPSLDSLDSVFVLFGCQEPLLEGGKYKVCFGFCFMFLFFMYFILKLVMDLICVMIPLPSCRLCYWFLCSMCHVLIGCHVHCVMSSLVCSCHVSLSVCFK